MKHQFKITGMSCAACSARVEKATSAVPGVDKCSVNLLTNSMTTEGSADAEDIIRAVSDAGYLATLVSGNKLKSHPDDAENENNEIRVLKTRLISSVFFLAVLMYISMGHMMWSFPLPHSLASNPMAIALIQLLLTIVVMIINGKFFVNGFKGIMHRAPNMDTLVALGSGAAFAYSVYCLFAMSYAMMEHNSNLVMKYMHDLYFESAAMILTLITVGKLLESYSKGKTTNAIKGLIDLTPKKATVIRNGKEYVIDAKDLFEGDEFVVKPGESIPADGIVTDGESSVDESALTGESIPCDKSAGSRVSAATINKYGYLKCKATGVGENTSLSKIIKMVTEASATKAPIAKIADKVSGVFVPVVIVIALITAAIWLIVGESVGYALARGISVLVISCPCALGLATPVAIMVGSGVGAKHGILFKTAEALEETGKIKTAVFDKTGTITNGHPVVTDIIPANGIDESELLKIAYALEKLSEHPLSEAIVEYASKNNTPARDISEFKIHPGNGLSGLMESVCLRGGNASYIGKYVQIPQEIVNAARALASDGKTPLYFSYGDSLYGIIAVADTVKDDSSNAIAEIEKMGIKTVMLTGDNKHTAKAIGNIAGVDEIIADVLPNEKERHIANLSESGSVAMIGDGINDAPALTRANVGIAIGAGSDIAIDAADVVVAGSRISDVKNAIILSKKTLRNIKQNLFWAFIYNIIGIPLAAGIWIPLTGWELNPMFGAAAMSLSSFCVVTNALRLNLISFKSKKDIKNITPINNEKENKKMEKTIKIEGMMCPHCEARVKTALEGIEGVESASASHETASATIVSSALIDDSVIKETIEAQGYKVIDD